MLVSFPDEQEVRGEEVLTQVSVSVPWIQFFVAVLELRKSRLAEQSVLPLPLPTKNVSPRRKSRINIYLQS